MNELEEILKYLKEKKYRLTKKRNLILYFFLNSEKPLCVREIQDMFLKLNISINKTTIYRELFFLKKEGIIREVKLIDNVMRYEITPENHYHHLVCLNCKKIENVILEGDLDKQEKMILKTKKFKILYHILEFYGVCSKCEKRSFHTKNIS